MNEVKDRIDRRVKKDSECLGKKNEKMRRKRRNIKEEKEGENLNTT